MKLNGAAIQVIRERTGLSISAAARAAGVNQSTWSRWETGYRNATPASLVTICRVLMIEAQTAIIAVEVEPDPEAEPVAS